MQDGLYFLLLHWRLYEASAVVKHFAKMHPSLITFHLQLMSQLKYFNIYQITFHHVCQVLLYLDSFVPSQMSTCSLSSHYSVVSNITLFLLYNSVLLIFNHVIWYATYFNRSTAQLMQTKHLVGCWKLIESWSINLNLRLNQKQKNNSKLDDNLIFYTHHSNANFYYFYFY